MGDYFHNVYDGGTLCPDGQDIKMTIKLYPNTSSLDGDVKSGSETTTTLDNACTELLGEDSITKYWVDRFHAEKSSYNYPNIDVESNDIGGDFESFLTDGTKNGTGQSLLDFRGAHLLIHNGDCTIDKAGGDGTNDSCSYNGGAFSRGTYCYSPRPEACSSIAKGRNSVIQEPFHQFIRARDSDVKKEYGDCDNDGNKWPSEEHSAGKLMTGYASPMLTYHVNDMKECGPCQGSNDWNGGYTTALSTCTERAIKKTGEDPCISQSQC